MTITRILRPDPPIRHSSTSPDRLATPINWSSWDKSAANRHAALPFDELDAEKSQAGVRMLRCKFVAHGAAWLRGVDADP